MTKPVSYPQPSQATEPSQAKCKLQAKLQAKLQEEGILYTFLTPMIIYITDVTITV